MDPVSIGALAAGAGEAGEIAVVAGEAGEISAMAIDGAQVELSAEALEQYDNIIGDSEIIDSSAFESNDMTFSDEEIENMYDGILGEDELVEETNYPEDFNQSLTQEELEYKYDKILGDDSLEDNYENIGDSDNNTPNEVESDSVSQDKENIEEKTAEDEKLEKINKFLEGEIDFEEVKEIYAEYYAEAVNSNEPWNWADNIPGGEELSAKQKKEIREYAREKEMVPTVPVREVDGKTYADFSDYVVYETELDEEDWNKTDKEQFDICNEELLKAIENNPELAEKFTEEQLEQIKNGETPDGYTWHHSEEDGKMQLVPFGVHNSTNHCGGRSEGNWADSPRQ